MSIVTRFAPSPTGFLHIGGARTALFNWLFARHHGGVFRLRIEDTDRARSTQDAIDAILDGLKWLELGWDDEVVYQSQRLDRHAQVATELLAAGHAYRCWSTPEEIAAARDAARAAGKPARFASPWRDADPATAPDTPFVVRFRAPREGETVIADLVQGQVKVANAELDDMVLLRADGTPTYMLSVVIDDHDMGITHAIRGDDHLTNAFRQTQLFRAMGWAPPQYAHIPLIHGADGAKLSKRHGALGVGEYRTMGFLPEAMRNYLLRLCWAHGDDEIIATDQAVEWFDLAQVGRSAARFDMDKLTSLNAHWLRAADDARLVALIEPLLAGRDGVTLDDAARARMLAGMDGLKSRARTLNELADNAAFYARARPVAPDAKAQKLLSPEARARLGRLAAALDAAPEWRADALEEAVRRFAEAEGAKLGDVAQPLRAALTGATISPGIFDVMVVLGRAETLARMQDSACS